MRGNDKTEKLRKELGMSKEEFYMELGKYSLKNDLKGNSRRFDFRLGIILL